MPGSRITRLCAEFYGEQQDKRLQFSVKQGCLEEIMGFLHKHVIEFGFAYVSQHQMSALEQTLEVKRLEFVPIQTVHMSLMVGDKHPLFRADSVDDAELKTLRFVQYEEDYFSLLHHVGHLNESLHRYGKLENIVSTNSDTALMDLVVLGGLCHLGCMPLEQEHLDPKVKIYTDREYGRYDLFWLHQEKTGRHQPDLYGTDRVCEGASVGRKKKY